jgi:hydroxyethylthiazole kinase-like uncharacterized protein yjeF
MKIVSTSEMREIDMRTSKDFGVPSYTLMENAGSAVARFILAEYPRAKSTGVICGKGNNGGDGFVVARRLLEAKREVRTLLLCDPKELRGDASAAFQDLLDTIKSLRPSTQAKPVVALQAGDLDEKDSAAVFGADLIVDAILGTGFRPPLQPMYAAAIQKLNSLSAPMVAVDIPSGADADAMRSANRGEPPNTSGKKSALQARADAVVTFTAPHPAHIFADLTNGPIVIADIGSPRGAVTSKIGLNLSSPSDFTSLLVPRARDANKGSYGHVVVIGGSRGKAGAAAMAGFAALRAGAGLSTVATPASVLETVASFHPELMTEALPETELGSIASSSLGESLDSLLKHKTLAIGPGISRHAETSEFVRSLLQRLDEHATVVVDADGLNAFEEHRGMLKGGGLTLVITPHPGEMSRLMGMTIAEIQANRLEVARRFASEHELIVVLKGHRTLTAAPDGTVWVNPTGNPGMATGGTGDILTGIVAGLLAQFPKQALEATALAVYLHGLAGDIACEALGENSLVATDLLKFLPEAFARVRNSDPREVRIRN